MASFNKMVQLPSKRRAGDSSSSRRAASALIDDYGKRFSDAIHCLEEGLEDSLAFYDFPEVDKKRISSTNGQERLNMEIRRRSRVVGVFPSVESYVRLTICYLIEYAEDWASERSYIREDKVLGSLRPAPLTGIQPLC